MKENDEFFEATLDGHRIRIVRCLCGVIATRMFLAVSTTREAKSYLASTIHNPKDIPTEQLRDALSYRGPGLLELCEIRRPDPPSRGDLSTQLSLMQQWVMLEQLPDGASWLPDLTQAPLGATRAVRLCLSVGEILLANLDVDPTNVFIRPELIWASLAGDQPVAMGLSTRVITFTRHKHPHSVGQLFTRSYAAFDPPATRRPSSALSFSLALMLQQWATGLWPFARDWYGNPGPNVDDRRHPALEVPRPLQQTLHRALTEDVAKRIPLPEFLDELRALTPARLEA